MDLVVELTCIIEDVFSINCTVENTTLELNASLDCCLEIDGEISNDFLKHFKGVNEITPTNREQILETKNQVMDSDVKVKEIPYYEVHNNYGGTTIVIG